MIRLRRVEQTDASQLCAIWTGEKGLPGYQLPDHEGKMAALIAEWNRGEVRGRRFCMLLIEADGIPAGLISLFGRGKEASMGISVHPSMQNQGIGTQAVLAAADHALSLGWERLVSECRTDNAASIALHEKCGFRRTGETINSKGKRVICWEMPLQNRIKKE